MADNILKLRVESSEYDQKLKKAAEGIRHLAEVAHRGGGELTGLEKAELDYIKSLGTMETKSRTAAGSVRELENTFKELTVVYNQLNDIEKQDEGGKALRASLDQIKQRAKEARTEIENASKALGDSDSAKGGIFSGLGSKMEGALAVFGGNLMTKAAGTIASLGSEMADMVKQGIEMAKAGEGIRIAFERLGRGDILDGLREATHGTVTDLELMKAAVKFNDFKLPIDELGTMLAFAQQKAKDTGQSVDYMVDSIVTGLGRKSLMILDNLGLSATEIRERMKETGDMTKAVGSIIRDQMKNAGDYVETAADRAAQANVSLQNKMEELGRKFGPVEEASNQLWTSMKIGILDIIGGPLATLLNNLTEAGRLKNALNDLNGGGNGKESQTEKALRMLREYSGGGRGIEGKRDLYNRQVASYSSQEEKAWRNANRLREELDRINNRKGKDPAGYDQAEVDNLTRQLEAAENRAKAIQIMRANYQKGAEDIFNPKPAPTTTGTGGTGTKPTKTTKTDIQYADDSIMAQEKLVSDLTQKWKTASGELRDGYLKDLEEAQQKLAEMTGKAKGDGAPTFTMSQLEGMSFDNQIPTTRGNEGKAQDKLDLATAAFATSGTSNVDFSNYISGIKNALSNANLGDELYTSMTEKLKDATTVSTLLQEMMERGLAGADIESTAQALKEKLLSPEGIDQTAIQSFLEELNRQIEEAGGVGLKLNADTGEVSDKDKRKDERDGNRFLKKDDEGKYEAKMTDIMSGMAGGISNVVSGLNTLGVEIPAGLQSVLGGMQAISSILSGIAVTVMAIEAISGADAIIPFANGGIVPTFAGGGLIGRAAGGLMIPGNSMSGDRLRLPVDGGRGMIGVNSGELILNRAQQGNLASQLEGGGMENLQLDTVIGAEDIKLVLNNRGSRTGKGEYVQSKRVR